jgi:tetratricopeptide (TPR) repeat protein/serine/threonine protein kinase
MNERDIFIGALQQDGPAARRAYLEEACGTDAALRERVECLLNVFDRAGSFLEQPAVAPSETGAYTPDFAEGPADIREGAGTVIGPYKLLEQIGEGGFGVVFMAEQQEPVRRRVALKVLKPGMDTRQVVARFEAERQALALMDHPNIAKVLDGGQTSSGRPYFVMDLVKGLPITAFCDQNQLTPRERLDLFVHVCQAVQHAHQKGIIHRDLKPSNVLVTLQDGAPLVKVIDFGIAKAVGQQLTDKTLFTGFAQMLGTPLYMSPEQAALSNADVDTRSDIYSLGVLLYELLTGTTPFDKDRLKEVGYDELRRIIREEEPPRPSTRISTLGQAATTISTQRKSDPKRLSQLCRGELDWIVMKALDKDRNCRYETASAFAADVHRYLKDEPVQACPPSAWYQFRKFARRNKPAVALAVAVLLVALIGGASAWGLTLWRSSTDGRIYLALNEANALRAQAQATPAGEQALSRWGEAHAAARRLDDLLAQGFPSPELRQQVQEWRGNLDEEIAVARKQAEKAQRDQRLRNQLAEVRTLKQDVFDKTVDTDGGYRDAFATWGLDVDGLTTEAAAGQLRSCPLEMLVEVAAALDDWALERRRLKRPATEWRRLIALARAVDPDPWRDGLRALDYLNIGQERDKLLELARTAKVSELPPASVELLGLALRTTGAVELAENALRQAQRRHPSDVWLNYQLAETLKAKKPTPWDEVVRFYTAARSLRPEIGHALGHALEAQGKEGEAAAVFAELTRLRPANPRHHTCLGCALCAQGKLVEAEAEHRWALKLAPNDGPARNNLGIVLQAQGRLDEAIQEYGAVLDLYGDAVAHNNFGAALVAKGQLDEAISHLEKAVDLDPKYAQAYSNLGGALVSKHRPDEAITHLKEAIRLDPKLAAAHSNFGSALEDKHLLDDAIAEHRIAVALAPKDAKAHANLGSALADKRLWDEAITELNKAIDIDPKLPRIHYVLADALLRKGQLDEAIREYRKAIDQDPRDPKPHSYLGVALKAKGQLDKAIEECQKAVDLDPNLAMARYNLGVVLYTKGRLDDAIAEYRKAVALNPKHAKAHCNLGGALLEKGQLDEAISESREAVKLDPKDALAHGNLGFAMKAKGQLDEATRELKQAIEIDQGMALAHGVLGEALLQQGRFVEARAATRRWLELLPERHPMRSFATRQLQQCERLIALDEKLPAILEGKEKPADDAERLALARLCLQYKRFYAASSRFYAEVFEAKPELAKDPATGHRYNAACAAALAGCGQGEDAAKLDEKERMNLRQQATDWLQADLAAWTKLFDRDSQRAGTVVVQTLQRWQADADLAGLRDKDSVAKLPEAEAMVCQKLWADVDALLARVKPKAKEAPPDKP